MLQFALNEEQAQKVLNALVKEPYIEVVDTINSIQQQASEQMETIEESEVSTNGQS